MMERLFEIIWLIGWAAGALAWIMIVFGAMLRLLPMWLCGPILIGCFATMAVTAVGLIIALTVEAIRVR